MSLTAFPCLLLGPDAVSGARYGRQSMPSTDVSGGAAAVVKYVCWLSKGYASACDALYMEPIKLNDLVGRSRERRQPLGFTGEPPGYELT